MGKLLICIWPQNEDLASLSAQQYYIERGADITTQKVAELLPKYVPDSCLAGSGMADRWASMVVRAFKEVNCTSLRLVILL